MSDVTIDSILDAARILADAPVVKPVLRRSDYFSEMVGGDVQFLYLTGKEGGGTGSFKDKGAYVTLYRMLDGKPRDLELVTASEGNHAPGLLNAANALTEKFGVKIKATVFCSDKIKPVKRQLIEGLLGDRHTLDSSSADFASAIAKARDHAKRVGATFVSGFDHPHIIDGQGTAGVDIGQGVDRVYCTVGGGGLFAGLSVWYKGTNTRVIGCELAHIPSTTASLVCDVPKNVRVSNSATISRSLKDQPELAEQRKMLVDGITLPTIGNLPFEILRDKWGIRTGSATIEQIAVAFYAFVTSEGIDISTAKPGELPEMASMPALVELMRNRHGGQKHVVILSGGNIAKEDAHALYNIGKYFHDANKVQEVLAEETPFYNPELPRASEYSLRNSKSAEKAVFGSSEYVLLASNNFHHIRIIRDFVTFEELGNSVNTSNPPYTMNMAKVPAIYSGGLVSWMNAIYDMNISPAAAGAAVVISGEEYQRIQNHINSPGIQRELERQAAVLVKARG